MSKSKFEILFRPSIFLKLTPNQILNGFAEYIGRRDLHKGKPLIKKQSLGSNELGKYSKLKHTDHKFRDDGVRKMKDVKEEKKDGGLKKVILKEWTEQSPAWFTRNQDENEMVKQLEVLQRFSNRYKTDFEKPENVSTQPEGKKDILKYKSSKNYGTFVAALDRRKKFLATSTPTKPEKKSLNPIDARSALPRQKEVRSYLTLSGEKPEQLKKKKKSTFPVATALASQLTTNLKKNPNINNFMNPDACQLQVTVEKRITPKLYSIVNPDLRNKEFEEYLKKVYTPDKKKEPKPVEPTIGEYFTGRYMPDKPPPPPKRKPKENLTKGLKDSLVEGRRTNMTKVEKPALQPMIHPKTTLQTKATDLPLQVCKNMKSRSKQDSYKLESTAQNKKNQIITKAEADKSKKLPDETLLNKLMKYFKR